MVAARSKSPSLTMLYRSNTESIGRIRRVYNVGPK